VFYLAPSVRRRALASALIMLLWFHAFRHVAMQIFSASEIGGLKATQTTQQSIAFGDLATAGLAVATIVVLHLRLDAGRWLAWVTAVVGTIDPLSATIVGIGEHLTDTATDLSWFILAFYVPILWVTAVILFWQLFTRRREPLATSEVQGVGVPADR
jgi:hypothetical protein